MALCIHRAPTPKRFSLHPPRAALRLSEHRDAEEEPALTASTGTAARRSCTRRKGAARAHPQHTPCIHKQPHCSPLSQHRVQCSAAPTPKLLGNPWDRGRASLGQGQGMHRLQGNICRQHPHLAFSAARSCACRGTTIPCGQNGQNAESQKRGGSAHHWVSIAAVTPCCHHSSEPQPCSPHTCLGPASRGELGTADDIPHPHTFLSTQAWQEHGQRTNQEKEVCNQ